jgi:hypothetical protein
VWAQVTGANAETQVMGDLSGNVVLWNHATGVGTYTVRGYCLK